MVKKTYLGDGVYVACDEFDNIILTTEDGIRATNTIVIDPGVLLALQSWLNRFTAKEMDQE